MPAFAPSKTFKPPKSVRLIHQTKKGTANFQALDLVPCTWIPINHDCVTCKTFHYFKTIHLWLEPDGSVLVSWDVFKLLRKAGLPNYDVAADTVAAPPPLRIGKNGSRLEVDKKNRKMTTWKPKKEAVSV
jgi:hypothetical protein